jgi:uncharacterized coiled-coil protein SlyX
MTQEQIQKRLEELQSQAKQQESVLLQISGAIQDCHYWLAEMSKLENVKIDENVRTEDC